jgi:hypothetical protein
VGGLPERFGAPFQGAADCKLLSGGLRYATTTGYFLSALQADNLLSHIFTDRSRARFCNIALNELPSHYRLVSIAPSNCARTPAFGLEPEVKPQSLRGFDSEKEILAGTHRSPLNL